MYRGPLSSGEVNTNCVQNVTLVVGCLEEEGIEGSIFLSDGLSEWTLVEVAYICQLTAC